MRISDTCPRMDKGSNGYTLIEILVIISIMGGIAGLAAPRLSVVYERVKASSEKSEVLRQISELGYKAFEGARGFELVRFPQNEDEADLPLDLPGGWEIVTDQPVRYTASGICLGGTLYIRNNANSMRVRLEPPRGIPVVE